MGVSSPMGDLSESFTKETFTRFSFLLRRHYSFLTASNPLFLFKWFPVGSFFTVLFKVIRFQKWVERSQ
ncbi:unnamed protein product [Trifolium pratense]|uniref:Uncharacterized protein n=1 Tax=Trifolium pratense TaxID=57577 RepID=A0ACB0IWD7_TRIPR|nr:unnamed protein product [Trifolium pratense]